jgi:DNA-binding GntR family transcriptional regulator
METAMANDSTLAEKIHKELYTDITNQKLKSGQKLTLSMLKERFGVSHTPIREALAKLESEGLVTYETNCGVRVKQFSEIEIRELFEFQAELEAMAVRFCSKSFASAPLIEAVKETRAREIEAWESGDREKWDKIAGILHGLFYDYAQNRYLKDTSEKMGARMELMSHMYSGEENCEAIYKRHIEICDAVIACDFEKAADLVKAHLQFSMISTLRALREMQEEQ